LLSVLIGSTFSKPTTEAPRLQQFFHPHWKRP
jgi:hypothetical protein